MLINKGDLIASMPLEDALQLGLEASESQIQQAITYLKTRDSELVPWKDLDCNNFSSIMKHREYSSEIRDSLDCLEGKEILVVILGENGNDIFDEVLNFPSKNNRTIETELSSLIGSDIISHYSKTYNSSGFEKDSVSVRVKFVTNPDHLEDIDLEGYMALVILESSETIFSSQVIDWLKESNNTIPLIYNFSEKVTQESVILTETESSSIAASWIFTIDALTPVNQMEFLLQAMNLLFVESDFDNTNSHVKSLIEEQYFHENRNKTNAEALFSACKLTSAGHNYFRRFIEKTISLHKKAIKKVQSLILPDAFHREPDKRVARDNWFEEICSEVWSEIDNQHIHDSTKTLIGLHSWFEDASQWRGKYSDESKSQKLQRWSNSPKPLSKTEFNRIFLEQGKGRNLYGGSKSHIEKAEFVEGERV